VLPPLHLGRRVSKAFQLAQGFGQLRSVVFGIDDRIAPAVVDDQAGRKAVITKTATALPVCTCRDAALVFTVDDLFETRDDVRMAMLAQLDHDPAATHFVGDCAGRAGTGEGIQDEVARVGGECKHSMEKFFWFRILKNICPISEHFFQVNTRLLITSSFLVRPPRISGERIIHFSEEFLQHWPSVATFSKRDSSVFQPL